MNIEENIREDFNAISKRNDPAFTEQKLRTLNENIKQAIPDCKAYQQQETLTSLLAFNITMLKHLKIKTRNEKI